MRYCDSCGAYIPDWADECPACGKRTEPDKKSREEQKKTYNASGAAAASATETSGEYHYKYKNEETPGNKTGSRRRSADKGTFTYDETEHTSGGSFRYDEERQRAATANYAREYKDDAKQNKWWAALCYFGPFFLLSWLLKPKSRFVRYHVNQGLVLFLCWVILNIFDFIPFVWVLNILAIVCFFCGLTNALKGKRKPMPVIGEITLVK